MDTPGVMLGSIPGSAPLPPRSLLGPRGEKGWGQRRPHRGQTAPNPHPAAPILTAEPLPNGGSRVPVPGGCKGSGAVPTVGSVTVCALGDLPGAPKFPPPAQLWVMPVRSVPQFPPPPPKARWGQGFGAALTPLSLSCPRSSRSTWGSGTSWTTSTWWTPWVSGAGCPPALSGAGGPRVVAGACQGSLRVPPPPTLLLFPCRRSGAGGSRVPEGEKR